MIRSLRDLFESVRLVVIDYYICENLYSIYFPRISINHIINIDNEYYF